MIEYDQSCAIAAAVGAGLERGESESETARGALRTIGRILLQAYPEDERIAGLLLESADPEPSP